MSRAGFGPKSVWVAVRSTQPAKVAQSLGLRETRPIPWIEGIEYVRRHSSHSTLTFLTPAIDGWVLGLLSSTLHPQFPDLAKLSNEFGEAQRFSTHRVVESHEWQRWVSGTPVRRFWWVGETGEVVLNDGDPSPVEPRISREQPIEDGDVEGVDETAVLDVAADWSLDPTELEARLDPKSCGLVGYAPTDGSHDPR